MFTVIRAIVTITNFYLMLNIHYLFIFYFQHRLLLFYHGHTLIEVKLTISDWFNSLQLHKICRRCNWIWPWCDYCPFLHTFLTIHNNFAEILIVDTQSNIWRCKYVHCAFVRCKYLLLGDTFRDSGSGSKYVEKWRDSLEAVDISVKHEIKCMWRLKWANKFFAEFALYEYYWMYSTEDSIRHRILHRIFLKHDLLHNNNHNTTATNLQYMWDSLKQLNQFGEAIVRYPALFAKVVMVGRNELVEGHTTLRTMFN